MSTPSSSLTIASNLKLIGCLGEGGMGSVWLADHLTLHTRVVVKFMAPELAGSAEATARFSREAAAAARVRSPHVVQMFDHGVTEEGIPYIVMELLSGTDLANHLTAFDALALEDVATLVRQVAAALTRAHELEIVHRDIKPENVFLTDLGNGGVFVKLLDFGIARGPDPRLSRLTEAGISLGTPFYQPPEVLLNPDDVSSEMDLWALAAVAYEALTNERAFPEDTVAGITLHMHQQPSPKPSSLVPGIPTAVDAWFARAFAIDRTKRFPDAKAMAEAFDAALATPAAPRLEEPLAHSLPIVEPPHRRRNGALIAIACAVVALVVAVLSMSRDRASAATASAPSVSVTATASTSASVAPPEPVVVMKLPVPSAPPPKSAPPANKTAPKKIGAPPQAPKVFDDVQ